MLEFEREVKAPDSKVAIYVFKDNEKGHTIYFSPAGTMNVVEQERKAGKSHADGFSLGQSSCSSCDQC